MCSLGVEIEQRRRSSRPGVMFERFRKTRIDVVQAGVEVEQRDDGAGLPVEMRPSEANDRQRSAPCAQVAGSALSLSVHPCRPYVYPGASCPFGVAGSMVRWLADGHSPDTADFRSDFRRCQTPRLRSSPSARLAANPCLQGDTRVSHYHQAHRIRLSSQQMLRRSLQRRASLLVKSALPVSVFHDPSNPSGHAFPAACSPTRRHGAILIDWRKRWTGKPIAVALPDTTEDVATVVRWCRQSGADRAAGWQYRHVRRLACRTTRRRALLLR